MKHIKLFEDFNEDIYIEDAKYIIISHLGEGKDVPMDEKWDSEVILRFELEKKPTDDEILRCEEHLKEEGFFLNNRGKYCVVGIGNSLDEYCLNWLNTNYEDLRPIIRDTRTFYTDGDGIVGFFYFTGRIDEICYINSEQIWDFFEEILLIKYKKIQIITKKWIKETYNLIVPLPHDSTIY